MMMFKCILIDITLREDYAMASNNQKDAEWAEAKKKCRLNEETVRMAKEMGLNPRSLIKNIPNKINSGKPQ